MIESINELSDLELRVAVMGINGYSINGIAECLNISRHKIQKAVDSINNKCEKTTLQAHCWNYAEKILYEKRRERSSRFSY